MTEKKKGLFAKAIDKLTDRDEKEELSQAEQKVKELEEKLTKAADEKAKKDAETAKAEFLKRKEQILKRQEARTIATEAKHVVVAGDSLTKLAEKYYGDQKMYMILYEANKEVIGDDPNLIKVGMELVVPKK
jgi:nucleoid-associated protein YgaU